MIWKSTERNRQKRQKVEILVWKCLCTLYKDTNDNNNRFVFTEHRQKTEHEVGGLEVHWYWLECVCVCVCNVYHTYVQQLIDRWRYAFASNKRTPRHDVHLCICHSVIESHWHFIRTLSTQVETHSYLSSSEFLFLNFPRNATSTCRDWSLSVRNHFLHTHATLLVENKKIITFMGQWNV